VFRLHERPDGSVWIAGNRGITRWHEGRTSIYGTDDGLPSLQVRAFHEAGETLWIGTYGGGLCRYRTGRFEAVPPAASFQDPVVYAILEDDARDLWMSGDHGITRVNRDTLESWMDAGGPPPRAARYDIGDGMKSSTCVGSCQPAAFRGRDGRLWFPTRRGAVWIDPRGLPSPPPPPAPLLEAVLLDGRVSPLSGRASAPVGRGDVSIEFTAPAFRSPAALRFRYLLEGFDRDWQEAVDRRIAQYTNLPPGRYVFRVATLAPDGTPSRADTRFALELAPRFHQTPWFYAVCLGAGGLAGWGLYRMKLRQVRERFSLVLAERNRIAREMHDGLEQGFAALSLQLGLCAKMSEGGGEPKALNDRLGLTRDLLEYARSEAKRSISDLRSEALEGGGLVPALSQLAEQFSSPGELTVTLSVQGRPRRLPGAVESNLLRIGQEAVANAVRHGQAHEVVIELVFARGSVRLKVQDAGLGFDTHAAPSERDGHFGLMGMRERAKKLGAQLFLDSRPGRGTAVRVDVPVAE
jgi:signal transduction histidine kinase